MNMINMKNSKKILIISHLYPSPEESTRGVFVHKQSLALIRSGLEIEVISPQVFLKKSRPTKYELGDIRVQAPRYLSLGRGFAFLTDITSYMGARKALNNLKKKPDVILAHTALPDGGVARIISEKVGIPYFVYVHGADVQHKINYSSRTRKKITNILKDAKGVFANSSKTKRLVSELGIDSVIIPMGVDEIAQTFKRSNVQTVRLISVCNLQKEKGIQYAIEAVKKIKREDLEYLIIGGGSYEPELKKLAESDKRINFLGRLGQKEVFDNLQKSDIFVLPSYNEAFGVAYLEAMSFGLPIIGIKSQGVEDIVAKGECGILVGPQNTHELQSAIEKLIEDGERCRQMGLVGKEVVNKYYLWDKIVVDLKKELMK